MTSNPSRGGTHASSLLALSVALLAMAASQAAFADSAGNLEQALPTARFGTSAVWTGTHAYVFGGQEGAVCGPCSDDILRFDPVTETVTVLEAELPTGRKGTAAVWDGEHAYVFGGYDGTDLDDIVRFTPATGTVTLMNAVLSTTPSYMSAVWDGTHAYIFGGYGGDAARILRYDPDTDTVATMNARLPTGRVYTSAVWDGTNAYIFAGELCSGLACNEVQYDEILRYNPLTDTITTMNAKVPTPRYGTSAAWDGSSAYVFGGARCSLGTCSDGWLAYDTIVRYAPLTDTVTTADACLPAAGAFSSAVWTGDRAYLFGGTGAQGDLVMYYRPDDGAAHAHCDGSSTTTPPTTSSTTSTTSPPPTTSSTPATTSSSPTSSDLLGNLTSQACDELAKVTSVPVCTSGPTGNAGAGPPSEPPRVWDPVDRFVPGGWATIVLGGFGLSSIAVASRVPAVQHGVRRAVLAVPLFTRLAKNSALDHPVRAQIVQAIEQEPGVHFHELKRRLGVSRGALEHHLRKLVLLGLVSAAPGTHYTCYFPANSAGRVAMAAAPILKATGARAILAFAAANPGANVADVAAGIGVTPKGVHFHLQRLEGAGLLKVERSAAGFRLFATPDGIGALKQGE